MVLAQKEIKNNQQSHTQICKISKLYSESPCYSGTLIFWKCIIWIPTVIIFHSKVKFFKTWKYLLTGQLLPLLSLPISLRFLKLSLCPSILSGLQPWQCVSFICTALTYKHEMQNDCKVKLHILQRFKIPWGLWKWSQKITWHRQALKKWELK